jgi:hypothetical protein
MTNIDMFAVLPRMTISVNFMFPATNGVRCTNNTAIFSTNWSHMWFDKCCLVMVNGLHVIVFWNDIRIAMNRLNMIIRCRSSNILNTKRHEHVRTIHIVRRSSNIDVGTMMNFDLVLIDHYCCSRDQFKSNITRWWEERDETSSDRQPVRAIEHNDSIRVCVCHLTFPCIIMSNVCFTIMFSSSSSLLSACSVEDFSNEREHLSTDNFCRSRRFSSRLSSSTSTQVNNDRS